MNRVLVEHRLHQESTFSSYLFALLINNLTAAFPGRFNWNMLFANHVMLVSRRKKKKKVASDDLKLRRRAFELNGLRFG